MLKRMFDFTVALFLCMVLAPLFLVLIALVYVFLGRPVFFIQNRVGLNNKVFRMVKFRTMKEALDAEGEALPDAERLTKFGIFLRRTSFDELPELFNVLMGDMSLVGPRPLLPEYLKHYNERQIKRHCVRPGITGYAQVNGRNSISWDEKFELDVWYVENKSFWLDLHVLIKTVFVVLWPSGVDSSKGGTMPPFKGSGDE